MKAADKEGCRHHDSDFTKLLGFDKPAILQCSRSVRSLGGTDADLIRLGLGFLVEAEQRDDPFESPLHLMGYIVGKNGMPRAERRRILTEAFHGQLPNAGSAEYMARWEMPSTKQRFYAIAGHIRRRRDEQARPAYDFWVADNDWTDDLNWFAAKFKP